MNKVFCIDEAKIITYNQKNRVKRNLDEINSKIKKAKERIKCVKEEEKRSEIQAILYKRVEDLLRKYGNKEREAFDKTKSQLANKLLENKNLIAEYEYSIDQFRKDYKAEDIDVRKVEQQISILEEKIKELRKKLNNERENLKGLYILDKDPQKLNPAELLNKGNDVFKSATRHYADKLNKYEGDLYEYKAIKVISLLGKSTPKEKIQQYENAIKKVKSDKFMMGRNTIEFLEKLETELVNDKKQQTQGKASTLIQGAKKTVSTMKDLCKNIVIKSPKLQEIINLLNKLGGNVKNNIWDLIYLASEKDLLFEASTYAKTNSKTYIKSTSDKKTFDNHNTIIKKLNTEEGRKELSKRISNIPYMCKKSVKRLLRLGKFNINKKRKIYTEEKGTLRKLKQTAIKAHRDKSGYLTQHLITPDGQEI